MNFTAAFFVPIIIVVILLIILFAYVISVSNRLARLQVKVTEAESGIDIALTKRYDVLTKMVDVVAQYTKYEKETLLATIQLRQNMSIKEKEQTNAQMTQMAREINALAENYPQLQANTVFVELQKAVFDTEEHLQAARRLYNNNVSTLNQSVVVFPSSIVAKMKNIQPIAMFQAETHKREDVSLKNQLQ